MLRGAREAKLCHEYAAISHTPNCAVEREVGDTNFPALRALLVSQGCRGSNANNSSWMRIYLNQSPPSSFCASVSCFGLVIPKRLIKLPEFAAPPRKRHRIDFLVQKNLRPYHSPHTSLSPSRCARAATSWLYYRNIQLSSDALSWTGLVTSQKAAMKRLTKLLHTNCHSQNPSPTLVAYSLFELVE